MKALKTKLLLVIAALAANQETIAFADLAPQGVQITRVNVNGSGCNSTNASSLLSPDGKSLSLLFDNYIAQTSPSSPEPSKKNCDVDVEFQIPAGWSFALFSADFRGFASIDEGALGIQEVVYSFPNAPQAPAYPSYPGYSPGHPVNGSPVIKSGHYSFSSKILRGPYNDNYQFHNELGPNDVAWSPCDSSAKVLRLGTALLARTASPARNGSYAAASVTLDSIDASVRQEQTFGMEWRKCAAVQYPRNPGYPSYPPYPPYPPRRGCDPSVPGSCSPAFPPRNW